MPSATFPRILAADLATIHIEGGEMEFGVGVGRARRGASVIIFTSVRWSSYPINCATRGATKYTPLRHALDGRDMPTIPGNGYVIYAKLGHEVLLRMDGKVRDQNHLFKERGVVG